MQRYLTSQRSQVNFKTCWYLAKRCSFTCLKSFERLLALWDLLYSEITMKMELANVQKTLKHTTEHKSGHLKVNTPSNSFTLWIFLIGFWSELWSKFLKRLTTSTAWQAIKRRLLKVITNSLKSIYSIVTISSVLTDEIFDLLCFVYLLSLTAFY